MRVDFRFLFLGLLLGFTGLLLGFSEPRKALPDPLPNGPAEQQWVDSVFNALTPDQRPVFYGGRLFQP
jgi:beta-N-acetylhexosaminidase